MTRRLLATMVATLAMLTVPMVLAATPAITPAHAEDGPSIVERREILGHSVQGRPIVARYRGPAEPTATVVVLGSMHGLETAGERVIARLRRADPPPGIGLWLVPSMNPDGRGRQRENARGVDLNRNFPDEWVSHGRAGAPKWAGAHAASEPETQAMLGFLARVRPQALISFHQPFGVVDLSHVRARPAARQLAKDLGMPARIVTCSGPCHGTLTGWADEALGAIAITVELPPRVSAGLVTRSARGVLRLAEGLGR